MWLYATCVLWWSNGTKLVGNETTMTTAYGNDWIVMKNKWL